MSARKKGSFLPVNDSVIAGCVREAAAGDAKEGKGCAVCAVPTVVFRTLVSHRVWLLEPLTLWSSVFGQGNPEGFSFFICQVGIVEPNSSV